MKTAYRFAVAAVPLRAGFFGLCKDKKKKENVETGGPVAGGVDREKGSQGTVSIVEPEGYFKYGFPVPVHDVKRYNEYVRCYDRRTRNPNWVIEHITAESLKIRDGDRKKSVFKEDESIPSRFRALLRDYFRSGYDRGHQAPAADAKFSQEAMDETFYLTNMCPQVGDGFNRDYWAHLEDFCRRLTEQYRDVRIVTGPLYLPKKMDNGKYIVQYEMIGNPPNVAVPTHFFKIIVAEHHKSKPYDQRAALAAFILPNTAIPNEVPLEKFEVDISAIENSAGVEFLPSMKYEPRRLCREFSCSIIVREFPKMIETSKSLTK
ncbi:hypothetical protein CANCADRAFT_55788 [Tortispora caseinolytica NRRL Y-17796]|uniref:Endonuclease n=1 Tax=Tortispora caseinolytica NRRL Y-17796 TaxID=767744 RepID=A0A1E4TK52_9ASCO|nr:hypothetical protein CANCADRAFT_55788 [Tortispora caseinolytica NRRL Y-17796]